MDKAFSDKGYAKGSNEQAIAISFDSTMVRDGCHYDLNRDFVGLDTLVAFQVVPRKFMKMVCV